MSGVPVPCRVTPPRRPCIRFLFVGSEFGLRLPPHPASRRRSCLRLVVPITKAHRGLPPPASTPCLAHKPTGPAFGRPDDRLRVPTKAAVWWARRFVPLPTLQSHESPQFVITRDSSFSIAAITRASVGSISDGKLAAIMPSRPIRYLWKFQRGRSSGRCADAHR